MDLIGRQAAIDELDDGAELLRRALDNADIVGAEREKYEWGLGLIESYISDIKELPCAERRGRWIDVEHAPNGLLYATCSACGKRQTIEAINYCGNCGARMEAGE